MTFKQIAEKLHKRGFKSDRLGVDENANDALCEELYNAFVDEVTQELEKLEQENLDEQRGKPKNRSEWAEYIGEV